MAPEQEMIEGLKLAAGAGVLIGLVAIGLVASYCGAHLLFGYPTSKARP